MKGTTISLIIIIIFLIFIISELDRIKSIPLKTSHYYTNLFPFISTYNSLIRIYSKCPNTSTLDLKWFPNHDIVRNNMKIITSELKTVINSNNFEKINNDLFFRHIADKKWKRFYIKWYGEFDKKALELCPKTCGILKSIKSVKLAMFSVMEPGAKVKIHRGMFEGCLRYHLGLETPNSEDCFIMLDNKKYWWKDGEAMLFNDTYVHYVENNTHVTRYILFLDVERPLKGYMKNINKFVCDNIVQLFSNKN